MRMAEASARMNLRDHVREDDVDMAIKVHLNSVYSFLALVQVGGEVFLLHFVAYLFFIMQSQLSNASSIHCFCI